MRQVKAATLGHLRSLGVCVSLEDNSSSCQYVDNIFVLTYFLNYIFSFREDAQFSPTEISFAVKQLLLKYLPSEHLAKVTTQQHKPKEPKDVEQTDKRNKYSFATVQYLKKYNLLASEKGKVL